MTPDYSDHRAHIQQVIKAVLNAADPYQLVSQALEQLPGQPSIQTHQSDLPPGGRIILLAIGKAASPMARAASDLLDVKPGTIVVVRPDGDRSDLPSDWHTFNAGHPLPTDQSLDAGQAVRVALDGLSADDLVIVLLSGGGSALLELPKAGIRLEDLRSVNQDLLHSGASIHEINVVRKAMSLIKAGGLVQLAAPARVCTLILSDVIGDDLSVIASGPTVPHVVDPADAQRVLQAYGLWQRYPKRFQLALLEKPIGPVSMPEPENILLANNATVRSAAADAIRELGFAAKIADQPLTGEARIAGERFAQRLRAASAEPFCLIQGGETTVTVHGEGKGGRNQEFAVAAGRTLTAGDRLVICSFATDGVDGPTDAAGAIVDSEFVKRAQSLALDPDKYLANNNVHPLLDHLGALIRTGATRTNLNDLAVGLKYPQQS